MRSLCVTVLAFRLFLLFDRPCKEKCDSSFATLERRRNLKRVSGSHFWYRYWGQYSFLSFRFVPSNDPTTICEMRLTPVFLSFLMWPTMYWNGVFSELAFFVFQWFPFLAVNLSRHNESKNMQHDVR